MGLLGSLTGWDRQKEAHNGILASHLADNADKQTKARIAASMVRIQRRVAGRQGTSGDILRDLSQLSRIKQMNFIAIACLDVGIPAPLPGLQFENVQNPYRADNASTLDRLSVAQSDLGRRSGVKLNWPGNDAQIDFCSWADASLEPGDAAQPATRRQGMAFDRDKIELATDLAHGSLLLGLIEKQIVRRTAEQVINQQDKIRPAHECAIVTALMLLLSEDTKAEMHTCQMIARMAALEWFEEGKISSGVMETFENRLYKFYG